MKPCIALLCLIALGLIYPLEGHAGAWARGKGKVFFSASGSFTWPDGRGIEYPDIYGGTYGELGLSERFTLGLDLGTPDITRPSRLKAVGFVRYSLNASSATHQFALDLGVGRFQKAGVLRIGAAYGRGWNIKGRNGWLSLEAYALRDFDTTRTAASLDATLGLTLNKGKAIAQLSAFRGFSGVQSLTFTPSYAYDTGKGRHIEIGVTLGIKGKPDPALKIGIWQEF